MLLSQKQARLKLPHVKQIEAEQDECKCPSPPQRLHLPRAKWISSLDGSESCPTMDAISASEYLADRQSRIYSKQAWSLYHQARARFLPLKVRYGPYDLERQGWISISPIFKGKGNLSADTLMVSLISVHDLILSKVAPFKLLTPEEQGARGSEISMFVDEWAWSKELRRLPIASFVKPNLASSGLAE